MTNPAPSPGLKGFPDVELLLIGWLDTQLPALRPVEGMGEGDGYRVCQDFPETFPVTTVRVTRASGANRNRFTDRPIVDIDVLAPSYAESSSCSTFIQGMMAGIRNLVTDQGVVQMASCVKGPSWLPDINQDLVRYSATYELHTHL